jgi:hypothetical protein
MSFLLTTISASFSALAKKSNYVYNQVWSTIPNT